MQAQAEHDRWAQPTPQGGGAPETLRIWLLGGFRVSVGSRSIGEQGNRLHHEQVMEALWHDLAPKAALNNLHYALHIARRTLEPSALDKQCLLMEVHLHDCA